jgi:arylsulfatase A-like enzyme
VGEPKCTRRDFLKFLNSLSLGAGLLTFGSCIPVLKTPKNKKTNFIIILVDDLGWTDAGCYGSKFYETPNIDRLANQGMRFTDGYAACAVCSPTRAAVMTGRYPARIGITNWISFLAESPYTKISSNKSNPSGYIDGYRGEVKKLLCPENPLWMELDEVTIAEVLKTAGYTSCHIGKWHLGPDKWYPDKQGFDYNIGGCDYGSPPSYFDPYYRCEQMKSIPTLKPRKEGEYLTDREADEACKFIRNHKDEPFFLNMAHYAVHRPIQGKGELIEKYEVKSPTHQNNSIYAAMIESVDQSLGRIMTTLDELDLSENTVIIFTSDNGGLMLPFCSFNGFPGPTNNKPLRAGKAYPYEGGIRVPFIVRWPKVIEVGLTCTESVISVDIFPTICEIAGIEQPTDRTIDGKSLMPLLKQTGYWDRDAIFWHYPHYIGWSPEMINTPYSIIRSGNWKLIKHYEDESFELYNLKNDLSEENDLSKKKPERVKELNTKLVDWLKETGAKLTKPNPNYDAGD